MSDLRASPSVLQCVHGDIRITFLTPPHIIMVQSDHNFPDQPMMDSRQLDSPRTVRQDYISKASLLATPCLPT